MAGEITLYGYWRSSAAYRVRIALNLKQLAYRQMPVHLVKNGGEQHSASYQQLNPSELVPVLIDGDLVLNQSMVILDYLEESYPKPALLPHEPLDYYRVKALAQDIAVDIHPLNNLRVLQYLGKELQVSDEQKNRWYRHWIEVGFHALEKKLAAVAGAYCFGDQITLADVCLVPQVYNAERFKVDMQPFPIIRRVSQQAREHPAFAAAAPENQPDAEG